MNDIQPFDPAHSRPMRLDRVATGGNLKAALRHLLALLEASEGRKRQRRPEDRKRLSKTLEAVVCEFYVTALRDPSLCLAYSRDTSFYTLRTRYKHPQANVTPIRFVVDSLEAAGLVNCVQGYSRRPLEGARPDFGRRSRVSATASLMTLLQDGYGVTAQDVGFAPWAETILLRWGREDAKAARQAGVKVHGKPPVEKQLKEYEDTTATRRMRSALQDLNKLYRLTDIALGEQYAPSSTPITDSGGRTILPPDFTAKRLYRVFNESSFDKGGRYYGAWWLSIPSEQRRHITINGEATVELDYGSMHPRLCYDLEGISLPAESDPYDIPTLEGLRPIIKQGLITLTNLRDERSRAKETDEIAAALGGRMTYKELLKTIEGHHKAISGWFRKGRGTELQRLDSEIASSVLGWCVAHGVPCLPVHDSFIVAASKERALREAMTLAYEAKVRRPDGSACTPVIR